MSLLNSGLIPVGNSSHAKENGINLQLFPTNQNAPDSFGLLASRPEKLGEYSVHEDACTYAYVTGFVETRHNCIFHILRNTTSKYSSHCSYLLSDCMDAIFTA